MCAVTMTGQTLQECQSAAERNYPLIRQYALIEKTEALTVSNIQKGWLPQVALAAQYTLQSDVTAFPEQLQTLYGQAGITMEGLKKSQYKIGVELRQTLYDGGSIISRKETARRQAAVDAAGNEVSMYDLKRRVNEMFFSVLLTEQRLKLNADLQRLLEDNEKKLASMLKNSTAAESDWLNVKAERLKAVQQMTELQSQHTALVRMLSIFCGIEIKQLEMPPSDVVSPSGNVMRPELRMFDSQIGLIDSQEKVLDAELRPRLGLFANAYYGYPGYNMFEDMMRRRCSWNAMAGVSLTWKLGALYTRRNDKRKLQVQRETVEVGRSRFLFDNSMQQIMHNEDISRYRRLMADDDDIIRLRVSVRKAAESRLEHGIIDVNSLVTEINNESVARISRAIHEIEMLRAIYELKFTTNN